MHVYTLLPDCHERLVSREVREYMVWQPGCSESPSGHQNNISIGTTVPKVVECFLHPAYCRAVFGPWTCWGTRKGNCRQASRRWFCSGVCCTGAVLGVSRQVISRKIRSWLD